MATHAHAPPGDDAVPVAQPLQRQLKRVIDNIDAVTQGEDPDALHDLRVATRRARVILAGLPEDHEPALHALAEHLDALRSDSSALRDLDVLMTQTLSACCDGDGPALPDSLRQRLEAERTAEREHLRTLLKDHRAALQAPELADVLHHPLTAIALPPGAQRQAVAQAHRRLRKRGKRALKDGSQAEHRLRIAAKKLRYALESMGDPLDTDTRKQWHRRCRKLQDELGFLHDIKVADEHLRDMANEQAERDYADAFTQWRKRAARPVRESVEQQVRTLRELPSLCPPGDD